MGSRAFSALLLGAGLVASTAWSADAEAQRPRQKPAAQKPAAQKAAAPKAAPPTKDVPSASEPAGAASERPEPLPERATKPQKAEAGTGVVETDEGKEGVKTYKFGAVEVEGRLRSPALIYFMRRVRAEFSAGDLGHRSFLRELAATERNPAIR